MEIGDMRILVVYCNREIVIVYPEYRGPTGEQLATMAKRQTEMICRELCRGWAINGIRTGDTGFGQPGEK